MAKKRGIGWGQTTVLLGSSLPELTTAHLPPRTLAARTWVTASAAGFKGHESIALLWYLLGLLLMKSNNQPE